MHACAWPWDLCACLRALQEVQGWYYLLSRELGRKKHLKVPACLHNSTGKSRLPRLTRRQFLKEKVSNSVLKKRCGKDDSLVLWLVSSAWGSTTGLERNISSCGWSAPASVLSVRWIRRWGKQRAEGLSEGKKERGIGRTNKKKRERGGREGGRGLDATLARHSCRRQTRGRDRALQQHLLLEWISLLHTPSHPPTHPPKLTHVCTHICLETYLSSLPSSEPPPLTYACNSLVVWRWWWCCARVCRSSATLCQPLGQPRRGEYHICVTIATERDLKVAFCISKRRIYFNVSFLALLFSGFAFFFLPPPCHKPPRCSSILAEITFNLPLSIGQPTNCPVISSSWAKLVRNAPILAGTSTFPFTETLCTDVSAEEHARHPSFTSLQRAQTWWFSPFLLLNFHSGSKQRWRYRTMSASPAQFALLGWTRLIYLMQL